MERLSVSSLLVAICIALYCVSSAGSTITATNCSDTTECIKVDPNAECKSPKCACKDSFKDNGTACVAKGLGDPCTAATDCKAVTHAICHDRDHICSCCSGFKAQANNCVAKVLGAACSSTNKTSVCTGTNDCISGHCACLNNSYIEENDVCKTAVGQKCATQADCPSNANCNTTCTCTKGHVAENGLCPLAVGTACTKASDCVTNADCDKTTRNCKCYAGYEDSKGKCTEQKSSADSVKKTINAIVLSFLCAALWHIL